MKARLSAVFDNSYLADRAVARIRSLNIPITSARVLSSDRTPQPDPALFVAQPYPTATNSYINNQASGLPQTTGTSLMMDSTMLNDGISKRQSVRLELVVDAANAKAVRSALINLGGRSLRS